MSIKPIDMQTNINQMHEVGRNEHAKNGAIAEQQQLRDQESADKSRNINSKLEEMKKGDSRAIKDQEGNEHQGRNGKNSENEKKDEKKKPSLSKVKDDRMGNIIDVFK
jgi:hypothetical protein